MARFWDLFIFHQFESGALHSPILGAELRFFDLFVVTSRRQHSPIITV